MEKRSKERRRSPRYYTVENIFVAFGERISKVGIVVDISMCGLAFEFVSMSDSEGQENIIEIFVSANRLNSFVLPCKKVYENPVLDAESDVVGLYGTTIKRCGVKFSSLNREQKIQLRRFLTRYAQVNI